MIRVIRVDGQEILLNANMVQNLTPVENDGTVVRLATGEDVSVKNQYKDIIQKIQAYRTGLYESRKQEEADKKKAEEKES
jgi:uncharacterized protein YlzI (FlbEa/FlbD family)